MKRLIFLLAASLLAQDVVFKSNVQLHVVNLSVKDKDGKPVLNLKKEDIEVFEDNVKQNVAVFELQQLNNQPLAPVAASPNGPEQEEVKIEAKAGTSVNSQAAIDDPTRLKDKRLIAIFFDLSNMPQADQLRAKDGAVDFIAKQMTKADLVSIITYGNRLDVREDFSDDRDRLLAAINKLNIGEGAALADTGGDGTAEEGDDSGTFSADDSEFNIFNTDRKLSALDDVCKKLSVYPETKALIYYSSGLSLTGIENQSQLKATKNACNKGNVHLYPADARGLTAASPVGDASQASSRGTGAFTGSAQGGRTSSRQSSQDTLYSLAADTGGKALVDSNDLALGIKYAQEDISSYYIVGYYPTNTNPDGKFRKVQIKIVNPQLQAKLDYLNGYYADKEFKKFNGTDKERQLEEALKLGDPVNELPLAVEVDYFRVAQNRYLVPISVKIPGSVLALAKKGGKQTTDFDFIGEIRDASGKLAGGVRDNIPVRLSEKDAAQLEHSTVQYDAGPTLPPGKYTLRFLARENQTGKMGTWETPFVVPDLSTTKDLRLSSVIWSSQKAPISAAVGAADNDKRALANHPLIQNGQKTVPSITRVFRKDQTLYVYFEVYDPAADANSKAPSVSAQVELLQGARKAFASEPIHQDKTLSGRPGVASFSFQIPLAKLNAGQYTAQVNVIDENGNRFAFPRNSIIVLPAESATQAAQAPPAGN